METTRTHTKYILALFIIDCFSCNKLKDTKKMIKESFIIFYKKCKSLYQLSKFNVLRKSKIFLFIILEQLRLKNCYFYRNNAYKIF